MRFWCVSITYFCLIQIISAQNGNSETETAEELLLPFGEIELTIRKSFCKNIRFILHNEYYPNGETFLLNDSRNINIDLRKTTKVLIHGWLNNGNSRMPTTLKEEYEKLMEFNILIIDWKKIPFSFVYPSAASATPAVGECVAQFLQQLYKNSNSQDMNVHLIGFSLGAHVAGFTGRKLMEQLFFVDRITGLDPANPLISNGLRVTDAKFVDAIHTTSATLGKALPVGDVDFYPNGGIAPQPGCLPPVLTCSHNRSWRYYAETINNPGKYLAYRCDRYSDFISGLCEGSAYMGEGVSKTARGVYFLRT